MNDHNCEHCNGTGERDSGGIMPWGEPAMAFCNCDVEDEELINALTNVWNIFAGKDAELATLRAEVERLRNMLERAKILIPAHNWVWHEDVLEAMK